MVKATIIRTDGTRDEIVIRSLGEVREYIGGYVEPVFFKQNSLVMMVDEDAKMAGKEENAEAARMLLENEYNIAMIGGSIAGDVIVCEGKSFDSL